MIDDKHFRKLENMYHQAPCNEYFQPKLNVQKGEAQIEIPVKPQFFHAAGAVHGSTCFKALDDAAFFSANSMVDSVFVLTSNFTVYFIRPISSGRMRAEGKVVHFTKNRLVAESLLYDSEDREVARGVGTFIRSTIELSPKIGYK